MCFTWCKVWTKFSFRKPACRLMYCILEYMLLQFSWRKMFKCVIILYHGPLLIPTIAHRNRQKIIWRFFLFFFCTVLSLSLFYWLKFVLLSNSLPSCSIVRAPSGSASVWTHFSVLTAGEDCNDQATDNWRVRPEHQGNLDPSWLGCSSQLSLN